MAQATISDKTGASSNLLGSQDYPFNPYPLTSAQVRFAIQDQSMASQREIAAAEEMSATEIAQRQAEEEIELASRMRIGSVVLPHWMSLGGLKAVLYRSGQKNKNDNDAPVWDVTFSPKNFGAFDAIVAKKAGVDTAAFNPDSPYYQDYAPLRRNIALLRNYLMCEMFPDGQFLDGRSPDAKEDQARYEMLNQMAEKLGDALHTPRQSAWQRLLKGEPLASPAANEFMQAANIPDKGAIVMYKYLEGLHETPTFRDFYTKNTALHWKLKPRSETPFSDQNYRLHSRSARMQGAVEAYEQYVMEPLRAPENLSPEDCNTSVELAREILERLRKLLASKPNRDELSQFADETQDGASKLLKIADSFREALARIEDTRYSDDPTGSDNRIPKADADPESATSRNKILMEAQEALEVLGYRMKVDAHKALLADKEQAAANDMQLEIDRTPQRYKTNEPTDALLAKVESGLKEADRIQRQAKIAQDIARKEANRAAKRAQRAQSSEQFASNMSRRLQRTHMSRRQMLAAIRNAAESSSAGLGSSARDAARGMMGSSDTVAGATVMGVSENAYDGVTDMLRRQREEAARQAAEPSAPRTR